MIELDETIVKALKSLGYDRLTEVQEQVIPLALTGKDLIVKSGTGSGKTAAFAIPICEKIRVEQRNPQVVVLTPTRELTVQIKEEIANIGRFKSIRCAAIFGRQPMEMQIRELRQRVHVIIGTPGRTFDHIEKNNINVTEISYLIIDEADKMLAMGFIEQVEEIIKRLPASRTTMLFSATLPDQIREICNQYMVKPIKIEVESSCPAQAQIKQVYYEVEQQDKLDVIDKIICKWKPDSCILFCNTREIVDRVLERLKGKGYDCEGLHGGMEQKERLRTMQSFKRGEFPLLIATDVAARGIHIEDISLVINYDMPSEYESYIHRIGRTGRAGNKGIAVSFVTPSEIETFHELEEYLHYQMPKEEVPVVDESEISKMILEFGRKSDTAAKADKSQVFNQEITRIRIHAGKKAKMRPGDIVGAITSIAGISGRDIGIIDIQDTCSYVEILGGKGDSVMDALQEVKIKGKKYTIKKVSFPT